MKDHIDRQTVSTPGVTRPHRAAVVLLSGGLDSATTLAYAVHQGFSCYALTVDYGQRHRSELLSAQRVAHALGAVQHVIVPLDLRWMGGSALTASMEVPKDRSEDEISVGIPITYVPARNTIFLAIALGWAESLGAYDIFLGINAVDYSGYPDCRPEFLEAFHKVAQLATKAGVQGEGTFRIHAPLMTLKKAEIILLGVSMGVDYSLTHSCYDPDDQGRACGRCDACLLRMKGFEEAGIADPTPYQPITKQV